MNILLLVIEIILIIISVIIFIFRKKNRIPKIVFQLTNIITILFSIIVIFCFSYSFFSYGKKFGLVDTVGIALSIINLLVDIVGIIITIFFETQAKKKITIDFNELILQKTNKDGKCNLYIKLIDEDLEISDSYSFYIDDLVIYFLLLPNTFCLKLNDILRDSDEQLFCRKIKLNVQHTELQTGNHKAFIELERELDDDIPDELFENNAMKFDDRKIVFLKLNGYFFTGKNNNFNEIKLKIRKQLKIKQFSRNIKFELKSQERGFNFYKYSD